MLHMLRPGVVQRMSFSTLVSLLLKRWGPGPFANEAREGTLQPFGPALQKGFTPPPAPKSTVQLSPGYGLDHRQRDS